MTPMYKFIVITGMFVMPGTLALSQDLPAPPPAPRLAIPPALTPFAAVPSVAPRAWTIDVPMPPQQPDWWMPAIAPIAAIPPMQPMDFPRAIAPMAALAAIDAWRSIPAIAPVAAM